MNTFRNIALSLLIIPLSFAYCSKQNTNGSTVFKRYPNPVIVPKAGSWYSVDVANASILSPSETKDNKWHLYFRGTSKYSDGPHSGIGLMEQTASSFDPFGGWQPYSPDPVLNYDPNSPTETMSLTGAVAMKANNKVYLYYKGKSAHKEGVISGSVSSDGGFTFAKFANNPLKSNGGPTFALYYQNKYYIYYASIEPGQPLQMYLSVSDFPDRLSDNPTIAVPVGAADSFDSKSVEGGKIFKIPGDNHWFMVYECSSINTDYPERFHCAYSTDLIHWTKVQNSQPLFLRGDAGAWDQGAIWTGNIIDVSHTLYIYYEGWGKVGSVPDRDQIYFPGGQSQIGVASVSEKDFLKWCGF